MPEAKNLYPTKSSQSLLALISRLNSDIAAGTTSHTAFVDGEPVTHRIPLGIEDYRRAAIALNVLVPRFAALHCIPHGVIDSNRIDLDPKHGPSAQHLHLHSHGGRVTEPIALPAAQVIDVPVAAQHEQLSSTQAAILGDV